MNELINRLLLLLPEVLIVNLPDKEEAFEELMLLVEELKNYSEEA